MLNFLFFQVRHRKRNGYFEEQILCLEGHASYHLSSILFEEKPSSNHIFYYIYNYVLQIIAIIISDNNGVMNISESSVKSCFWNI